MEYISIVVAAGSFIASSGVGLIAWGLRGELALISQKIETFRADVRANMAESENKIVLRINGSYMKTPQCEERHRAADERHAEILTRLDRVEELPARRTAKRKAKR